ncbi:MAG: methyltransferase domain-containing protein [Luteitalea sp.]|nr:methyltransferase domain-containing protein [Luteitalea sp.]
MTTRTITPDELAQLKAAREEADRRYNDALSALYAALPSGRELPASPPVPDERLGPTLNERWPVLKDVEAPAGWRGRVVRFVRRSVEPFFARQQAFNAALVEHLNNNVPVARATHAAVTDVLDRLQHHIYDVVHFQVLLMGFVQQITSYTDTKDYEMEGLARRRIEDLQELIGAVGGVGDELQKRLELLGAREHRFEARVSSVTAAHEDFRGSLALLQRAQQALAREVEQLAGPRRTGPFSERGTGFLFEDEEAAKDAVPFSPVASSEPISSSQLAARDQDAYKYVAFEDAFRGRPEDIRARLAEYLPTFEGASDIVDLGCGRGEFLALLREHGIAARGLDINPEMVQICRERGLRVDEGDALTFLASLPDESLGGLLAAQVVEHLQPDYLVQMLATAQTKLRPGARIVLETVNVACWFAFFQSYIRDVTHIRPLHPDTLSHFVRASGFQQIAVRFSSPLPAEHRLLHAAGDDELHFAFNRNVDRLNDLLFTHLDYAVIGTK